VSGTAALVKSEGASGLRAEAWGALVAISFATLAFALYAPSLAGPFLSDDVLYLEHNEALALPLARALRLVLLEPYYCVGNWSPLHQLWLLAGWRAFGADPLPHRVANVILHVLVSIALVAAARRAGVGRAPAFVAGALLLVHPAAVEAVAWINQSKTLLAVGLALLALERWLAHVREPRAGRLAAATAWGVAALLAKPAAVPLPAILLVAAWTHGAAGSVRRAALDLVPLAIAAAIVLALNLQAQTEQGGVAPWFGGSPEATARILPWIAWRYVRLVVAPFDLAHGVHPAPTSGWGDPRVWLPAAGLAATAGLVGLACRRSRERWLGPAWFALMLLPVVQLVPMINLFAERYLYAALPGALLLAAQGGEALARRGRRAARALAAGAAAAGCAFAIATFAQARLWADPEALYAAAANAYPLGRQGWTGLGAVRHQRGDLEGAADAYLRSLAVFPEDGHVRHLLARVRLRQGDPGRALYDLEEALRLGPTHHDAEWTRRTAERLQRQGVVAVRDAPPSPPDGGGVP
jgi:tetratricopeptide (TPR) repeat protein